MVLAVLETGNRAPAPARSARLCGRSTARAFPATRSCKSSRDLHDYGRQASLRDVKHSRSGEGCCRPLRSPRKCTRRCRQNPALDRFVPRQRDVEMGDDVE